jgi:hypothetical protein
MVRSFRLLGGMNKQNSADTRALVCAACQAVLLLSLACGRGQDESGAAAPAAEDGFEVVVPAHAGTYVYRCANNMEFTLRVLPDTVWAVLPDRTVRLPRDKSAAQPRFSNGDMDFSMAGEEAQLETEATHYTGCRRQ